MASLFDLAKKAKHAAEMLVAVGKSAVAAREEKRAPKPIPKAEARDYGVDELLAYDGTDPDKPILLAIRGKVYDVTRGRMFYGPGGPYALFAGRECARAFALDSLEPGDRTGDLAGLTPANLSRLDDWIDNFETKYGAVGNLV